MRKIFFAFAMAILLSTFNQAAAQDVWISSGGNGSEWYIVDETIEGDANGKFRWANVKTKLVGADGSFVGVTWKFTQISPDGGRLANWVYATISDNQPDYEADVLPGTNAEKILLYCLKYLRM